jgi:hypothetical protein
VRTNLFGVLSLLALGVAGLFSVFGAILPWAEAPFGVSKAGVEGDGAVTLVLGLIIGAIAIVRWIRPSSRLWKWTSVVGGGLLSGLILTVAVVDIADVESIADDAEGLIKVGSGLYVTALAGGVGLAGAAVGVLGSTTKAAIAAPSTIISELGAMPQAEGTEPVLSVSSAPTMSAAEELVQLIELREKGLITEEEYQQKRQRVIERL